MENKKKSEWDRLSKELSSTTDKLGKPIDKGIIETVIALNALGFKTKMSCEGHIGKSGRLLKHSLPFPWISIGFLKNEINLQKLPESKLPAAKRKITKASFPLILELMMLIDEFYKDRYTPLMYRVMAKHWTPNAFRIQSFIGPYMETQTQNERSKSYHNVKKEMRAFTLFLKKKFFQ
jgi:hypothetical protein